MNAREIETIEAKLAEPSRVYPSPEQMERYIAKAHLERNRELAKVFAGAVTTLRRLLGEIRRIAVACTAARLHLPNA